MFLIKSYFNKMKQLFALILLSIVLFISCKKDGKIYESSLSEPPVTYTSYYSLKTGSSWVYEQFTIDGDSVLTILGLDSSYVEKDTVIRGKTFTRIFNAVWYTKQPLLLTDSLHYVIDHNGRVLLSSVDFSNILAKFTYTSTTQDTTIIDTLFTNELKMTDRDLNFSVPAGDFNTINALQTVSISPKYHSQGTSNPKYNISRYAVGIGPIYETMSFLSSDIVLGRRLLRYHVN
jgi:hypothetical protein